MDGQWNQNQQQGNPNQQQGNPYQQQGNPYQQQANPYQQQGNPYQQANPYMGGGGANYGVGLEPEKAPNIFQQFVFAFVPPKYNLLTKVKVGSMIGFVTLLVLIATLFLFGSLVLELSSIDMEEVTAALPDFAIKNGKLHLDEDFLYDEDDTFVYMTEEIDGFTYDDAAGMAEEGYSNILLVGRDRLSLMQNMEYQQLDFRDLNGLEISRSWIVTKMLPFLMVVIAIAFVFFFVGRVLWYFFCAMIYMLIGMAIAAIVSKHIETGELFRIAVYAKVLFFVIATGISLLPFVNFAIPLWFRIAATTAFMAFAIVKLPGRKLNTAPPMSMGGQGWQ